MQLRGPARRFLIAVTSVAAMTVSMGPAYGLGCTDLPNASIDPGLDAFLPFQSFGRLLPEFKTENKEEEVRRTLVVDRLVVFCGGCGS